MRARLFGFERNFKRRLKPAILALALALPFGLAGQGLAQAAGGGGTSTAKQPVSKASAKKTGGTAARQTNAGSAQKRVARKSGAGRAATKPSTKAAARTRNAAVSTPRTGTRSTATSRGSSGARLAGKAADQRGSKTAVRATATRRVVHTPAPRLSVGQSIGLHQVYDPLALHSSVALVLDATSGRVLFEKNTQAVLPIASITKLMTAMVVLEAELPLGELLQITEADVDTEKFTRSRLAVGTRLTRDEMLQLALMSSENRAASALGRHYPGGLPAFVQRMNEKAGELGMTDTRFIEPTGLSSANVSTAVDLAKLVVAASQYPLIRDYSTASSLIVEAGPRLVSYRNTNRLIDRDDWEIGLQKTGYISEAGNCLVMRTSIDGRPIVLVLLDADGKLSRFGDAQRIRSWLETGPRPGDGMRALAQPSRDS